MNHDLENLRKKIDLVDQKLIDALAERFKLVSEIGKVKKANNLPTLDLKRWNEILLTRTKLAEAHNLPMNFIKDIFNLIHKLSLKIEKET